MTDFKNKQKNLWNFLVDFSRAWYAKIPKKMKRTRHRATLTHIGTGSGARAAVISCTMIRYASV